MNVHHRNVIFGHPHQSQAWEVHRAFVRTACKVGKPSGSKIGGVINDLVLWRVYLEIEKGFIHVRVFLECRFQFGCVNRRLQRGDPGKNLLALGIQQEIVAGKPVFLLRIY